MPNALEYEDFSDSVRSGKRSFANKSFFVLKTLCPSCEKDKNEPSCGFVVIIDLSKFSI